ncbi:MAG: cupredoxin domain-containing protein [Pseudomonadales bacterium]
MTPDRILVTLLGIGSIVFIVWYFWMNRASGTKAAVASSGYQEAMILVKGGYTPDVVLVERGKPVRLNFRREETASCSERVLLPDFDKSAELPTGEVVALEFLPEESGEFEFSCQMGMFRGKVIVQ